MNQDRPIKTPAGYATAVAVGFADASGNLVTAGPATPLPVTASAAVIVDPLVGVATQTGVAGPFAPSGSAPIVLQLSGDWEGTVSLLRSTDDGATRHPLTLAGEPWGVYLGNICEPVWTEGEQAAQFYLDMTIASGTLAYRVSQ